MIRINLLPVREERRKADLRQFAALVAVTLGVTVAVAVVFDMQMKSRVQHAEARVAGIERQIERYKPQLKQVKEYRATKEKIEQKLEVIEELERKRSGPVRLLDELATHTPEKLWLTKLEAEQQKLRLRGMSLANELVASFLESLNESPYFADVELLETNATKKKGIKLNQFELRASLVSPEETGSEDVQQTAAAETPRPAGR